MSNYETFSSRSSANTNEISKWNSFDDEKKEKETLFNDKPIDKLQPTILLNPEKNNLELNGKVIDPENQHIPKGSAVKQICAALVAQLGTINTGMAFGFAAIATAQLEDPSSTLVITEDESSWIASMSSIGTPIGCLLSGYMMDQLGRKLSLIITQVPALLGWILISFAPNVEMIYAGRFFVGLGSGMVGAPSRVYTSEVTQPHLRGMLIAFASVGVSTGVLLEYALGSIVSWKVCANISALIPALALILMFIYPETPSFLISKNKPEKARASLEQFRGKTYNVDREMETLINFSKKNNLKRLTNPREILHAIVQPNALRPFAMLFFYFLIYQWSGTNAITFYAVEIFKRSGATMNKYLATTILGVVRVISTIVACILCRRCGRRPLTMISSVGCGLSMLGLGGYMWLYSNWMLNKIPPSWTWFPVLCIFSYTVTCTLGFLVIPWVMIGEVYPTQVRGIIGGFTTMAAHVFVFIVVKTFPLLKNSITEHGTFILYGSISFFGTLYFYLFLPETKNKTLQEIEDYFSGRSDSLKTGRLLRKR